LKRTGSMLVFKQWASLRKFGCGKGISRVLCVYVSNFLW